MTLTPEPMAKKTLTRRRMIAISAGFAGLAGAATLGRRGSEQTIIQEWRGIALGAETSIKLAHKDRSEAVAMLSRCRTEIDRLEDIFSLYRPGSEIARLNTAGELTAPSIDFERCLEEAHRISTITDGAFDITVAPLWNLYAQGKKRNERRVREAIANIDYRSVIREPGRVALQRDQMAITLNGIAQGYITDRIAELLRDYGYSKSLVSLGEFRALEAPETDAPWRIGINGSAGPGMTLENAALATSGANGLVFNRSGKVGDPRASHLIDPHTGNTAPLWEQVSVIASSAARADALSTGLSFVKESGWPDILERAGAHIALGQEVGGKRSRVVYTAQRQN